MRAYPILEMQTRSLQYDVITHGACRSAHQRQNVCVQIFVALLTFKMATAEGRSCDPMNPHRSCDFNKTLEVYRFASAMTLLG